MNDALNTALAALDTSSLPEAPVQPRLHLVSFTTRPEDGRITMDATRAHSFKLVHTVNLNFAQGRGEVDVRKQAQAHNLKFNPFRLEAGTVRHRGSLVPQETAKFRCAECGREFTFDLLAEKKAKDAETFFCAPCGKGKGTLRYAGTVPAYLGPESPELAALEEAFKATDLDRYVPETMDMIPQVMAIYEGKAPAAWYPTTTLEQEAMGRFATKGKGMLPYWIASQIQTPIVGLVILAYPSRAGWIDGRYLFPEQGSPGRFSPGYKLVLPRRQVDRNRRPVLV